MTASSKRILMAMILAATMTACSGGYQRGMFQGYVIDATQEQITAKIGKPDRIDTSDPNAPRWIYNKKTFDPDNQNQNDDLTIIVFKKDPKSGQFVGAEVQFQ